MLSFSYAILILGFLGCDDSDDALKRSKVFISEQLENREDSLGTHDQNCLGYFKEHFNPFVLSEINFVDNTMEILEQNTGIKWNNITDDSLYNFNEYFSEKENISPTKEYENKVIYLIEILESNKQEIRYLSTGSDDSFMLWVNGVKTASVHKGRNCQANSEFSEIKLKKGKNILLYKVENGLGGWKFYKNFTTKDKIEDVLIKKRLNHITDLLEACILPDSVSSVKIKKSAINVSINTFLFTFNWIDNNNEIIEQSESYRINSLPKMVPLPFDNNGIGRLRTTVRNENNEIIYIETNPIFHETYANKLALNITATTKTNDPIFEARRMAVLNLFDIEKTTEKKKSYSTRIKAHGLWDLFEAYSNRPKPVALDNGPSIMGYRSVLDNSIQMYRIHIPESVINEKTEKYSILYSIDYIRHDYPTFLQGVGRSHFYMSYWQGTATNFNTIIVTPYGRGEDKFPIDEINAIYKQIVKKININNESINLLGSSTAAQKAIEILEEINLPVANVGLLGSTINLTGEVLLQKLKSIYNKHTKVKFFIVHGIEDEDYSIENMREIVKVLRVLGFDVTYVELPDQKHGLDFVTWYRNFILSINSLDNQL